MEICYKRNGLVQWAQLTCLMEKMDMLKSTKWTHPMETIDMSSMYPMDTERISHGNFTCTMYILSMSIVQRAPSECTLYTLFPLYTNHNGHPLDI